MVRESKLFPDGRPLADLTGKVVIITGASAGIGRDVARAISAFNAKRVILPVRNRAKGELALQYIKEKNAEFPQKGQNLELWDIDFADIKSVREFAKKFIAEVGELHFLFNNAGIIDTGNQITKDGFAATFQVNHLAGFLLTTLLLDTMKATATPESPARIVFTGSSLNNMGKLDFDNLNGEKSHRFLELYSDTKLMNTMMAWEINARFSDSNVLAVVVHPGAIATELLIFQNPILAALRWLIFLFGSSPEIGAEHVVIPALSPNTEYIGKYYSTSVDTQPNTLVFDAELRKKALEKKRRIIGW